MSIKALKTLLCIAEQGSLAAAGERLGLTQAAVSQQVKALEQQLSAQLFDRVGRNLVFNPDGRKVLERAEQIVALYDVLDQGLAGREPYRGELLIGAIFSMQTGPLGPILNQLRQRYPELKIKLFRGMSIELAARVEAGELDAAFITEPQQAVAQGCSWTTLESEPFYVIAPASAKPTSDRELLERYPFIRLDPRALAGGLIEQELRRRQLIVNEMMELDSLQCSLNMVEQGLGVTVMAYGQHQADKLRQQFLLVPFGDPPIARNIGVYQRQNHQQLVLVEAMVEAFNQL